MKTVYPPTNTVCGGYKNDVSLSGGESGHSFFIVVAMCDLVPDVETVHGL